ncbi:MAG TPA: hypothetical protein VIU33_07650 [Nitrospiria bacterium]
MFAIVILGGMQAALGSSVFAQEGPTESRADRENYRLSETEIRGELRDVLGTMRLRESEIIGSLERPRLSYSLPWKKAELFLGPEDELEGDLLGDSYPLIDPGRFEQEVLIPTTGTF